MADVVVRVSDPELEQTVRGIARTAGVVVGQDIGSGTRLVISDRAERADGVPLVLVASPGGSQTWAVAAAAGAEQVVVLPDGAAILDRRLRRRGSPRHGSVVRVVGARGGAGASTLAAGVALAGARSERRVVLVDGDPHGAGLDLTLGAEQEKGLRWGDLADVRGSLPPRSVLGRLPVVSGVPLLSHRRGESSDQPAWVAVTESVAEAADLVVADLPRFWVDRVPTPARCLDVLVVPHDVAGVAAARSLLDRGVVRSDAVVSLRRIRGPLAPAAVSEALPHQRIVDLPHAPGVAAAADFGDLPRAVSRGGYATACRQLVELVAGSGSRGT